jgi:hypothetical protein
VNWSARNNQRLLAAAEPEEEDDYGDPDVELDRMAEEKFLQWREEQQKRERVECRNPSWDELGRRLGQPTGYRGDAVTCSVLSPVPSRVSPPEAARPTKRRAVWQRSSRTSSNQP